jgi:hypothetical protein
MLHTQIHASELVYSLQLEILEARNHGGVLYGTKMEKCYYTGRSLYNGLQYSYIERSETVISTLKNRCYYRNFSSIPLALEREALKNKNNNTHKMCNFTFN